MRLVSKIKSIRDSLSVAIGSFLNFWFIDNSIDILKEGPRVFLETIPHSIVDNIWKPIVHTHSAGEPVDNSITKQSLRQIAILGQKLGSRFLPYIRPENILFIFTETLEAFYQELLFHVLHPPFPKKFGNWKDCKKDKRSSDKWAIILCYVEDTTPLKNVFGEYQDKQGCDTNWYKITWSQFQDFRKRFQDFGHGSKNEGFEAASQSFGKSEATDYQKIVVVNIGVTEEGK